MTLKENLVISLVVFCFGGWILSFTPSELLPVSKKDLFITTGVTLFAWAFIRSEIDIYRK